ncbi:MFS peptide transporter-like protein Ptr2 [Pseudovirgaria hyperparasitica]|uniref:MFS peptide transporter-like protein Ptr2 n=1 Tax=Pseudovirgaria hyperparasitica TaxID=470096 RepID=A0A6A6VUT8_9PEZI|nr:MFS peptide transporter-like protein Ptr2 [Pseudovirgaria hyperparasitica]KAF2754448.1 MFS peptide transporter-like protein Ptr2 [Pseudovirgaria hyperparasitica]
MPGDITDMGVQVVDPAIIDGSGDRKRSLGDAAHAVELPPVYAGETVAQDGYLDHENLPTDEELHTLRRVPAKIPWKVYTIAFVELTERLSYYGTTQVFVNFIQQDNPGTATGKAVDPDAPDAQPGALGKGQQAATGLTTFNQFWQYMCPLGGAFIADTYLGRFTTIWIGVLISITGHIVLTASAAPSVIANPNSAIGAFAVGLVIMGLGTGCFKPNISPLVAEQIPYERMHVSTLKSGERVIIDPAVTTTRIYNWFYLFINIGALIGQVSMVYAERYVGFYLAFLLPTVVFMFALPVLFFCRNMYNRRKPEGSVIGPAVRLLFRGVKGRFHLNPIATWKHMHDGTFWSDLRPSRIAPENMPSWYNFDDAWVDEVHRGWSACAVFLWYPLYWLTYNQINNNLTSQAATMELHGVPNDILANIDPFALMILIPLWDLFLYPTMRKFKIKFTPIKKIAAGFFTGSAAMVWTAVLQHYIYKLNPACGSYVGGDIPGTDTACPKAPINVWAQTGAYILIAQSEIFASITSLEYGFSKAPKNMRSLVAAFALFMSAISAAIGEAFLPLSTDPLLVWNYGSMAVIAFIAGIIFYVQFRTLDKQEDELNLLPTGHIGTAAQAQDVEKRLSVVSASANAPSAAAGEKTIIEG